MTVDREKLEHYMKLKNINNQLDLLVEIGRQNGEANPQEFALYERFNFSKTVNGQRPLKVDFIIALERIFGVPISRLVVEGNNTDEFDETDDSMPPKGFSYYAYKDDMDLYKNEFRSLMRLTGGHCILINTNEYDKSFFDYVVEYKSINAIRFLSNEFNLMAESYDHRFFSINIDGFREMLVYSNVVDIALLIIESGDIDLLNKVFPLQNQMLLHHMDLEGRFYFNDEVIIKKMLEQNTMFDSLFKEVEMKFIDANQHVSIFNHQPVDKKRMVKRINPLINICLKYTLNHMAQYKEQAKKILIFGQKYNSSVIDVIKEEGIPEDALYINGFGDLYCDHWILVGNLVFSNQYVQDKGVQKMIEGLPMVRLVK